MSPTNFTPQNRRLHHVAVMLIVAISSIAPTSFAAERRLVDPTIPPATAEENGESNGKNSQGLQLQATKIGQAGNIAIINGTPLRVGSKYNGWQVSKIEPHAVTLKSASGTKQILLYPSTSKTPPRRIGEHQARRAP